MLDIFPLHDQYTAWLKTFANKNSWYVYADSVVLIEPHDLPELFTLGYGVVK